MMRFPHIVGFQQCQLFDTCSGHSEMNEVATNETHRLLVEGINYCVEGRDRGILGDLTSPEAQD